MRKRRLVEKETKTKYWLLAIVPVLAIAAIWYVIASEEPAPMVPEYKYLALEKELNESVADLAELEARLKKTADKHKSTVSAVNKKLAATEGDLKTTEKRYNNTVRALNGVMRLNNIQKGYLTAIESRAMTNKKKWKANISAINALIAKDRGFAAAFHIELGSVIALRMKVYIAKKIPNKDLKSLMDMVSLFSVISSKAYPEADKERWAEHIIKYVNSYSSVAKNRR